MSSSTVSLQLQGMLVASWMAEPSLTSTCADRASAEESAVVHHKKKEGRGRGWGRCARQDVAGRVGRVTYHAQHKLGVLGGLDTGQVHLQKGLQVIRHGGCAGEEGVRCVRAGGGVGGGAHVACARGAVDGDVAGAATRARDVSRQAPPGQPRYHPCKHVFAGTLLAHHTGYGHTKLGDGVW
jgi:hypothetical protein